MLTIDKLDDKVTEELREAFLFELKYGKEFEAEENIPDIVENVIENSELYDFLVSSAHARIEIWKEEQEVGRD